MLYLFPPLSQPYLSRYFFHIPLSSPYHNYFFPYIIYPTYPTYNQFYQFLSHNLGKEWFNRLTYRLVCISAPAPLGRNCTKQGSKILSVYSLFLQKVCFSKTDLLSKQKTDMLCICFQYIFPSALGAETQTTHLKVKKILESTLLRLCSVFPYVSYLTFTFTCTFTTAPALEINDTQVISEFSWLE